MAKFFILQSFAEGLLGQNKISQHGTFASQFYTHQCATFWKKTQIFNAGFFSTDRLVVLLYKAKFHLRGEIVKEIKFPSDRIL